MREPNHMKYASVVLQRQRWLHKASIWSSRLPRVSRRGRRPIEPALLNSRCRLDEGKYGAVQGRSKTTTRAREASELGPKPNVGRCDPRAYPETAGSTAWPCVCPGRVRSTENCHWQRPYPLHRIRPNICNRSQVKQRSPSNVSETVPWTRT